ncbi:autoinducer 2 import system permease LsrD [Demequina sp. B12]|uniref:ABC transporter permease subunit n=1 Tax=Demequina sp. B12 TaxID=2992757 RepID=UPI00237B8A76|nr:autoinducer 2 import system permease LsrD [Demequina sp. B12]MDE0573578.1 autoinducer 2 import system permease LsrD [Demequina sp. B12]
MKPLMTRLRSAWRWESALLLVLVLELAIFGMMSPSFLEPSRLIESTTDYVYLGVVGLALALVMITGGIDISIGSIVGLSAVAIGVTFSLGLNIWLAAIVGLVVGVLAGIANAAAILTTGAHPMVITLGTQFLFIGIALSLSGLLGVSAYEGISGLPESYLVLGGGELAGIPVMLIIFGLVAAAFWFLLERTVFGRRVRLFGANPGAARYAGFPLSRITIGVYALTGLASAIAAVLLTSYLGSARSDLGASVLMPVLTLVVIGGVSLFGGEGSISGVIVATFVVGILQQGLRFQGLTESEVAVGTGAALIIVASLRWWSGRTSERLKNLRSRTTNGPTAPTPLPAGAAAVAAQEPALQPTERTTTASSPNA